MAHLDTRDCIRVMLVTDSPALVNEFEHALRETDDVHVEAATDHETVHAHCDGAREVDVVAWHDSLATHDTLRFREIERLVPGCPVLVLQDEPGDDVCAPSEYAIPAASCSPPVLSTVLKALGATRRAETTMRHVREELAHVSLELSQSGTALANQLRRPVVNILSAARRFRAAAPPDEHTAEMVGVIHECAAQLHHSVARLAAMERVDDVVADPAPVALGELLDRAIERLGPFLRQSRVSIETSGTMPLVWGDARRLRQLIESLLVEMSNDAAHSRARILRIRCEPDRTQVRFELEVPMEPSEQASLTPMHELPEVHVLPGLSAPWDRVMRRRVVRAHRGTIGRTSTEHAISTWFTLPRPECLGNDPGVTTTD